jgi:hypothetical protein
MVVGTKTIALVLIIAISAVLSLLLFQMSHVLAQQPLINDQSMNATSSSQGNTTVENTTIDQAFDSLRDTFGSLFKK